MSNGFVALEKEYFVAGIHVYWFEGGLFFNAINGDAGIGADDTTTAVSIA